MTHNQQTLRPSKLVCLFFNLNTPDIMFCTANSPSKLTNNGADFKTPKCVSVWRGSSRILKLVAPVRIHWGLFHSDCGTLPLWGCSRVILFWNIPGSTLKKNGKYKSWVFWKPNLQSSFPGRHFINFIQCVCQGY